MTWTGLILVLHVLSALWLAAAAFGGAVVRAAGRRAPDLAGKVTALRIGWRFASIFGLPGSIVAGLTGLYLLDLRGWGFKPGWVHVSVTLWIVILALNLTYSFPRLKRTVAAAEASLAAGAPSEEFKRLASAKGPRMLADLTAVAVVVFIVLMVLKPF